MTRHFSLLLFVLLFVPVLALAQYAPADTETFERAKVVLVDGEMTERVPGTSVSGSVQQLTVEVLSGVDKGKQITFQNDFTQLQEGDVFFLRHVYRAEDARDYYTVADPYRLPVLWGLLVIFVALTVLVGGKQGTRALLSLAGSLLVIIYVLLPGIVAGYSPLVVAIGAASIIIIVGSYVTHGCNRTTTAAVVGMIGTVVGTGLLAAYAVSLAQFSGYTSEDVTYIHFQFRGTIDLVGLLLGGMLIGLLGVLYDSAIGQAVAVEELFRAGPHLSGREVFARAMRIGREHIGALVNTLAIAYVGAALPLLLLFSTSSVPATYLFNTETLATEIVRILIGSIGLILAVPVTTLVAVVILSRFGLPERKGATHRHMHQ